MNRSRPGEPRSPIDARQARYPERTPPRATPPRATPPRATAGHPVYAYSPSNTAADGYSSSNTASPGHGHDTGLLARKTVRELEAELETAAHFIRKMQETEAVLTNHVREVVAEKNDAVQELSKLQGKVAALEAASGADKQATQAVADNANNYKLECERLHKEQSHFEERVLREAKAERHEVALKNRELEGQLQVESVRREPLLAQIEGLKQELTTIKGERDEQDTLVTELHKVMKDLKASRDDAQAEITRERALAEHAVTNLEASLEQCGIEQTRTSHQAETMRQGTGLKMIKQAMTRLKHGVSKAALQNWTSKYEAASFNARLTFSNGQRKAQNLNSAVAMLLGAVSKKQMRSMYNGLSSWRQNQLVTELHQTRDDASQLKESLTQLVEEHGSTMEEMQAIDSQKELLELRVKDVTAERQILVMEVENLKAVGEQLVSDLVATASEVFEEFDASYAKTPFDSAGAGPTAKRLAKSAGVTGLKVAGR